MESLIGIEMGGTSCKVARFDVQHNMLDKSVVETSQTNAQETLDALSAWIEAAVKDSKIAAIGIACFGPLCLDRTSPDYGCVTKTSPK